MDSNPGLRLKTFSDCIKTIPNDDSYPQSLRFFISALNCWSERSESESESNYRNYAPLLDVKGGIITEKVFPVFSESFFGLVLAWSCTFGS